MSTTPTFAHVVFRTAQPEQMRDWYCDVLDGRVAYENDAQAFITYDHEHHRVALLKSRRPLRRQETTTAAAHHVAYTFAGLDDLLDRYVLLRDKGITPAVCVAHGVTTSMYYEDPDGNFVEMQIDLFADPEDATAFLVGAEFASDPVGPAFDPEAMVEARRAGASVAELTTQEWASHTVGPDPMTALGGN